MCVSSGFLILGEKNNMMLVKRTLKKEKHMKNIRSVG